jgi:acetyltransferase-like isoleucine patch superfamily enzyme
MPVPAKWRVQLQVWHGVRFSDPSTTFLGEDVYFDDIYPEYILVGKFARITSGTRILTHFIDTNFTPQPNRPFHMDTGKVVIGDYVFIGMNVVIAKPIVIGDWAIIGANTVVTKDVPEGAILVGSPAKVVGYRKLSGEDDGSTG